MNDKFSKLIVMLRKEKNMTQQQLADKLNVTDKAVSKWERGICLPDITLISKISKIFDISVAELLNGERTNNQMTINNVVVKEIKKEKNITKKRNIVIILLSFIIVVFTILFIFFLNNYNNVRAYVFFISSKSFNTPFGGIVLYSNQKNYINMSNIEFQEGIYLDIKTAKFEVYFDDKLFVSTEYNRDTNANATSNSPNDGDFDEFLKGTSLGEYGYADLNCKDGCSSDSFMTSNKNEFPNNMKMTINYCLTDDHCFEENFKIWVEEIVISDKFFWNKDREIKKEQQVFVDK